MNPFLVVICAILILMLIYLCRAYTRLKAGFNIYKLALNDIYRGNLGGISPDARAQKALEEVKNDL